jgi:magnesium-transporting ATPase (P-type)
VPTGSVPASMEAEAVPTGSVPASTEAEPVPTGSVPASTESEAVPTGSVPGSIDAPPPLSDLATWTAEQVFTRLGSDPAGLTVAEAAARLERTGGNVLEEARGPSLLGGFVTNVTNLMAGLLWIAGGLALLAELPQLAVAVWVVNVINGVFSTWQEHRAEQAVAGPATAAARHLTRAARRHRAAGALGGAGRR